MDQTRQKLTFPVPDINCASCVAKVEKKLNELDGVEASVNFATKKATVEFDDEACGPDDLASAVNAAGYTADLSRVTTGPGPAGRLDRAPEAADRPGGGSAEGHPDHHAAEPDGAAHDHMHHAIASTTTLRHRLVLSAVLSVPLVLISMVPALQFDYWQWVALALAIPIVFWCGLPFHRSAFRSARHGTTTMDTLISLGTLAAFFWSLYSLLFGTAGEVGMTMTFEIVPNRDAALDHLYFETAAVVTTFLLAGRYFEDRAKERAGNALTALVDLGAKKVSVLEPGGGELEIPVEELVVGRRFVVRPGEKVATDGVVVEGSSALDESLVTGESVPVERTVGDHVIGASINSGGRLVVEAERVGSDTALAQIARLVEQAQTGKAPVQRLADRISAVFVPVVLVLSLVTFAFWMIEGSGAPFSISAAVSVLIIACPCALGLATPMALLVGSGRGARIGILIKGPEVLESTREVDTILLDKTGTLTSGRMTLAAVAVGPDGGTDRATALRLVGAVEHASEHPIARAIASGARDEVGDLPPVDRFRNLEGAGVEGTVDGHELTVGRPDLVAGQNGGLPPALAEAIESASSSGQTAIAAAWDGRPRAVFAVSDRVKPTAVEATREFGRLGLEPILLTGDNETTARAVADEVGIENVISGVMPAGKVDAVREQQQRGRVVAMVGDGVNDSPALAQADLGISIGTGSDVAIEASDLTLVSGDPRGAGDAIRLSRATLRTIKSNLFFAFVYNVILIPVAMTGLLNPILAGAAMALSSVFVVSNSLRLRRFTPRRG
ncbi:MAG: heavy metal translocating P-type ATPase [Solirubrobacterales bacterium]|nr:heavy metal translocating P-type ATPase [Solirubrobacterales bacterium]